MTNDTRNPANSTHLQRLMAVGNSNLERMNSAPIKIGDVVRLKSGGPDMTVTVIHANRNRIGVVWFEGKKKFEDLLPPETLVKR